MSTGPWIFTAQHIVDNAPHCEPQQSSETYDSLGAAADAFTRHITSRTGFVVVPLPPEAIFDQPHVQCLMAFNPFDAMLWVRTRVMPPNGFMAYAHQATNSIHDIETRIRDSIAISELEKQFQ